MTPRARQSRALAAATYRLRFSSAIPSRGPPMPASRSTSLGSIATSSIASMSSGGSGHTSHPVRSSGSTTPDGPDGGDARVCAQTLDLVGLRVDGVDPPREPGALEISDQRRADGARLAGCADDGYRARIEDGTDALGRSPPLVPFSRSHPAARWLERLELSIGYGESVAAPLTCTSVHL